jgi:hypothetical protein
MAPGLPITKAMEETVWSFDVDDVESVPDVINSSLRELERQGMCVVDGPTVEHVETPDGDRWSVTFLVEGPAES